jgi:acyl-CoA synthetase (AMP-forming)/AMP-acid ligase II
MIIVSGENIYPTEIENLLSKFKKITLGIVSSIPDEITQNTLILVYESEELINHEEIYNFLKIKLSKFKIPKKIFNIKELGINEIPKAANKKILRKKLKSILYKKLFKKF